MFQPEVQPFIPIDSVSEAVFAYYSQALRQNPDFLKDEIESAWNNLAPDSKLAFEKFHAALYPDNLPEQQLAARRTLLAAYIERQARLSEALNAQFGV